MGAVLAAVALIVIGVINLVAPDLLWSLTKLGNEWQGRASERTGFWDLRRVLGGVVLIVLGAGVLIWMAAS